MPERSPTNGIRILHPDEIEARFNLAQQAFIASMGGSEEHALTKAQMAEDVPSVRSDWTYALAWALFPTKPKVHFYTSATVKGGWDSDGNAYIEGQS